MGNNISRAFRLPLYHIRRNFITTSIRKLSENKGPSCSYPGHDNLSITNKLSVINSDSQHGIPVYQVLNMQGFVADESQDPQLGKELLVEVYRQMVLLNTMDRILYESQGQGHITFYVTCYGEEATHFGSATALEDEDLVFAQYREAGVLMWRGFPLIQFMHQCFGNEHDFGLGRQMPVHYGSKEHNFVTISSPVATQMPQASGAAYALKMRKSSNCVICYFGEGAASEGDAHAAFNFAATLECPVIFFCRNNGYAITTPTSEQYRGDGIAGHGPAYGISTFRVDGNDLLAVHNVTRKARDICINEHRPVIIEAMTYRVGNHGTSDDASTYRSVNEVKYWKDVDSPINRLRNYLENQGWWSDQENEECHSQALKNVTLSFEDTKKSLKPTVEVLFSDVYKEWTPRIRQQYEECMEHIKKYPQQYPTSSYR